MAHILVTGSADGLGRAAAASLLDDGHQVVVHARSETRRAAVRDLLERGAGSVVGDLADLRQVRSLAEQANELGPFDAVIHNAGVIEGPTLLPVNVVAPYALTALVPASRAIYLSSSMHRGGHANISTLDWSGAEETLSYSDSKLLVTVLMAAIARRCPAVLSNAVDPGWVPTRMGGPSASDPLELGHVTQTWLAVSDDPDALVSGQYWFHRRTEQPHRAVHDQAVQDALLDSLAEHTGIHLQATRA
ncbi:SDR family NAD(P)-dependent oxidoreductase [Microbacterium sp. B2969]|uniref:SDR family NAD(P)-dependent oxidoreductase n=1 Tax=Microbacterium alkaliflavum TaxID=3248839 RepID=A0ABW7QE60_9MICO